MKKLFRLILTIAFVCAFVGINAVFEILASTLITGAVGNALYKAKAIK